MTEQDINYLKSVIHDVPDYPIEGIMFRDITGILDDAKAFLFCIEHLKEKYQDMGITKIVGTEARGFLFGAPLALALGIGFVPVRKPGKLPRETFSQTYDLEYGQDTLEIHQDALVADDKVLMIDDLLATGGTIEATTKLIRNVGASVTQAAFVIGLPDLKGPERLESMGVDVYTMVDYEGE
ncbi:adenine phosphoribosyltransferase [Thalassotalea sp. HSM 43]|uniref:adenine phosphoribosyltransferase n=1 Tax=Thalassotalea sp. HSM 43 TaxID=2552945 RepID=UPI0010801B9E|nr:adenine phosphoribosyltransferase [Thalassotalea sp. HSM 43]QBY03089.1 adenine phosphoribosyltransferase [Thalassotalea sp. HSM 43]